MARTNSEATPKYEFITEYLDVSKQSRRIYSIFRPQVLFDIGEELRSKFYNPQTGIYDKKSLVNQWNNNIEVYSVDLHGKRLFVSDDNKKPYKLSHRKIDRYITYREKDIKPAKHPKDLEGFCRLILNKTYVEWYNEQLSLEAIKVKQKINPREELLGLTDIFLSDLGSSVIKELQQDKPQHFFLSSNLFLVILGHYQPQLITALKNGVSFSFLGSTFINKEDENKLSFVADALSFPKTTLFASLRDSVNKTIQLMDVAIRDPDITGTIRARFTSDILLNRVAIFQKRNANCSCLFAPYINKINTVNSPMFRWETVSSGFIDTIIPTYEEIWNAENTYSFSDYIESNKDILDLSSDSLTAFKRIKKVSSEELKQLFIRQS